MGQEVGFLAHQTVHHVKAMAGQKAKHHVRLVEGEGLGEITAETQPIGDDKGIDGIGLIQVAVGPLACPGCRQAGQGSWR